MSTNQGNQGPFKNLISLFAEHRVAANLLMMLMILAGIWGLKKLNTQFFPTFELDIITIAVPWSGAAAEDVESSIILPIERELKSVNGIDALYSTATQGSASIRIELEEDSDVAYILDEVKQKVDGITNLPADAEKPIVQQVIRYDNIARILITSPTASQQELRTLAREYERELLQRGIRKIDFVGLPEEEIAIQVSSSRLHELNLNLSDVAQIINQRSIDLPAGTAAQGDGSRQIRSLSQQRDVTGFNQLPLITDNNGQLLRLGDIATIDWRNQDNQTYLSYQGQPAIQLLLRRTENDDTLEAAAIMREWLTERTPTLPPGIQLIAFDEGYEAIQDRINLLVKNGVSGLILVIAILFLFLNARVAFWVTIGIPVSFMATLAVLYGIGGSINMISLFGMIMALGIIVDDAIVVGEDTLTHLQMGEPGLQAAIGGAHRMLAPVMASSLTTIAAFLPLLLIGGTIGNILIDIPTVVICVILASVVECFLILPGHLHHSLHRAADLHPSTTRIKLDAAFNHFKNGRFRGWVENAIEFRWVTITIAFAAFIIAIGLVSSGRIKFNFFPAVEMETLNANIQFTSGSSPEQVDQFLQHLDKTLRQTEQELGGDLVKMALQIHRKTNSSRTSEGANQGDEFGALYVQFTPVDSREIANGEIINKWRSKITLPAGIEKFTIDLNRTGPPGKSLEVKLVGDDVEQLKAASLAVQDSLRQYNGVSNVDDDLPFGKSQLIYELTPAGKTAGLTLSSVGRQLRSSFDGQLVQIFNRGEDEIEVRVVLPDSERDRFSALENLPIILPNGGSAPLANVVKFSDKQGLDRLQRIDGQLAIKITTDLDEAIANANEIIADLQAGKLQQITSAFGVEASFEGRNKNQRETLADMQMGLLIALLLIFIILSWVFSSYSWPFAVMLAIPLGLTGAIAGHLLTGQSLTILSLFGCFGLSGIVINDSIVLITFYQKLRNTGMDVHKAIVEAACQRLRAVLLTSLTTIAGLTPILFETSLQAQFLIPMATSLVFGLAFGTVLILLVVPALLITLENGKAMFKSFTRGHQSKPS
ncbi:efflux RND transporter permease subunit [Amphritea sp. 2_MG-2023]|uniref:efflux RND transporter permease subunit n=1 Tax=Amphritea TaxID=515417 RepID=UPI001C079DD7|nr:MULTISPECIES: efflux RND transporter permease subunit [Amphritea]MBU2963902.1 efflux RND transporter permease subunit [Amphritea atlantica]MDO6419184.1 efflux RND transporter permease subunit [Amphritea sp. 2_MG-2023]